MSSSMYRNQVDRLTKEIAGLEGKAADERSRAAKERGEALRATSSITSTTSPSSVRQKLKDAQRREENATTRDKAAARLADQIATKRRALTTAQTSLDRALKQDREKTERDEKRRRQQEADTRAKEERESKRRREEERRHLADLERRQRALQSGTLPAPSPAMLFQPRREPELPKVRDYQYDICLSFAGEDRAYVEMVARDLKNHGVRVFYDHDEAATLWGKELTEHLDHIYREASRYCVLFVSAAYAHKEWTRLERRSALSRAMQEEDEYILPARFDDTELPGLRSTVAYIDLRNFAPATLVKFLLEKVGADSAAA